MPVRILLVEDDAATRDLIREYLSADRELEIVAETPSGRQAVTLADEHRPDIVLLDLVLQEMDGLKASKQIAKRRPDTHIIILTNYAFDDLKARSRDVYGSSAFLDKGEIPTRLLKLIRALVKSGPGTPPVG